MKTLHTAQQPKKLFVGLLLGLSMMITACGDGEDRRNIEIPGVDGPTVTLNKDDVLITMVFEKISLDGGIRYAIPKYQNSYIEVSPDLQSSGTLMSVSVSLDDVFGGGLNSLPAQVLPGGRALPGVAGGSLPAVAFSIEKFNNMAFYLGPDVFGFFVPANTGIGQSIATFRFYSSGSRVGNISLVGEDSNGENSGVLLMLDMKGSTKKRLKKQSRRY